jgi:hypothetical protein
MSLCGHDPPIGRCWECKKAGLVPFAGGELPPAGWAPPPGSPAERDKFPPAAAPAKPRLSIRALAALRRP